METLLRHWDDIFQATDSHDLGWYESSYDQMLKYLDLVPNWQSARIFVAGAGTTNLLTHLLEAPTHVFINDLSATALNKLKAKYHAYQNRITWNCQDIATPLPATIGPVDLWMDRAVLHFLTQPTAIQGYFENLFRVLAPGGYVILAEFSELGAEKCAGLPVNRYSIAAMQAHLPGFELIEYERYTFINPKGATKPYIYALFQRQDIN